MQSVRPASCGPDKPGPKAGRAICSPVLGPLCTGACGGAYRAAAGPGAVSFAPKPPPALARVAIIPYLRNLDCTVMLRTLLALIGALLACAGCSGDDRTTDRMLDAADRIVAAQPDSVLRILREIPPEALGGEARRARYALLYVEAADRGALDVPDDSLLRIAEAYYGPREHDLRNHCKMLYYSGRACWKRGDKSGALRMYLEVEEKLRRIDEPRYLGLLYLRIGEVYHAEQNFARAHRYYREARDLVIRGGDSRDAVIALLGMAETALRMRDPAQARRCCSMALDLADELHDDSLARQCLGKFARLYIIPDTVRIPEELLGRIEASVRGDTTHAGLATRARVQLLRNHPDSALRTLQEAERRTSDPNDLPALLYTAYRANVRAGHYREASRDIHRYILMNDSLNRNALRQSAGMIEKEFLRERAAFAEYRMRSRRRWEMVIAAMALLAAGGAAWVVRQQMRLQRERSLRQLSLVREARAEYGRLSERLEQRRIVEDRLKGLVATRFDIVDRLGKTFYERENTASQQAVMFRQVKELIDGFAESGEMLREVEQMVDAVHDGAMRRLRHDFPAMKESDCRLLCYVFGGFSPQVISLFMRDSVANVYARKSRLKSRIKASDVADREFYLSLFG